MKRALAETALVSMILAIAGGLLLAGVVTTVVIQGREKIDLAACRANVELAVKSTKTPLAPIVPIDKCFTNQAGALKVKDEDERVTQLSTQIAQLVQDCKYQFAESGAVPWSGNLFTESPSICFVCSTFRLPIAKNKASDVNTDQFLNWLKTHYEKGGQTYYDYLLPAGIDQNPNFLMLDSFDSTKNTVDPAEILRADTAYAVVHYAIPEKKLTQLLGIKTSSNIAVGAAQVISFKYDTATGGTNWVYLTPADQVSNACAIQFTRYPIG